MEENGIFNNGESQSGSSDLAGVAFVYTVEAFEDTLLVIDRNADAVIFYSQYRMVFDGDHVDFHFAEGLVILDRIAQDIQQNLSQMKRTSEQMNMAEIFLVCMIDNSVGFPVSIRVI